MSDYRFVPLLGFLLLEMLIAPMLGMIAPEAHPLLPRALLQATFIAMLISAAYAVSETRRGVTITMTLAGLVVLLGLVQLFVAQNVLHVISYLANIAFITYVIVLIVRCLFQTRQVTFNIIAASLCVYLLMGVGWSIVYSLLASVEPASFVSSASHAPNAEAWAFRPELLDAALYYSFVTLTTLGYGDIHPATPMARMLAAMEAVLGQIYLAVLVARLVGMHISQEARQA